MKYHSIKRQQYLVLDAEPLWEVNSVTNAIFQSHQQFFPYALLPFLEEHKQDDSQRKDAFEFRSVLRAFWVQTRLLEVLEEKPHV